MRLIAIVFVAAAVVSVNAEAINAAIAARPPILSSGFIVQPRNSIDTSCSVKMLDINTSH